MKPTALIIRTAGTNCDRELVHAFELAGARAQTVHLNRLIEEPGALERAELIGFPGGFSYGDDIAAGRIFANRLRRRLSGPLRAAVARGVPMIGVCNGFQVLVKAGVLPFPGEAGGGEQSAGESGEVRDLREAEPGDPALRPRDRSAPQDRRSELPGGQAATLGDNVCGRFIDRWVGLRAEADSVCVWTRGLGEIELPIAHGEGRFVVADDAVLRRLREGGQVALRYVENPNGSVDDIAGVCDPSGLVLGLMPHPERFVHPTQHPSWTRRGEGFLSETTAGLRMFENAVVHVRERAAVGAEASR